jgi:hypothetical protein
MTLFGVSDSELLGIVNDLADENGWATTFAVRTQVGEDPWLPRKGEGRTSGVGIRLAWLRRYGWVEKGENVKVESDDADYGWRWSQSWRLTAMGQALLDHPELSVSVENALAKLNPAQRLRLTRELGEFGNHTAPEIRSALRRQWQRSLGR